MQDANKRMQNPRFTHALRFITFADRIKSGVLMRNSLKPLLTRRALGLAAALMAVLPWPRLKRRCSM